MLNLRAPAKINWFLEVLYLREDGFHDIKSLIQKVTLFDRLTIKPSNDLTISTDASIPMEENLAYKAALLLKNKYEVNTGAEMRLVKTIPVGAGLGGGSSDAASALEGLNELWSLGLTVDELCDAGEEIGSDVPFFLRDSLSYVEGRGEKINECFPKRQLPLLLVNPSFAVSTAWVYNNLSCSSKSSARDEAHTPELTKKHGNVNNIKHFIKDVEGADLSGLARSSGLLSNDLESVTLESFPVIANIKERLSEHGSLFSLMSGSGPTVFGVFKSLKAAETASRSFKDFWTAVVYTMT
jgi:4-diphosphocytidyl-2-C-methyl-D-erythritol kinase